MGIRTALPAAEIRESADRQLTMFTGDRPSVMEQLAAKKTAEKSAPAQTSPKKSHVPEI